MGWDPAGLGLCLSPADPSVRIIHISKLSYHPAGTFFSSYVGSTHITLRGDRANLREEEKVRRLGKRRSLKGLYKRSFLFDLNLAFVVPVELSSETWRKRNLPSNLRRLISVVEQGIR